ncbi:5400_t:CDS:1, partial [Dentiscutata erythropus]
SISSKTIWKNLIKNLIAITERQNLAWNLNIYNSIQRKSNSMFGSKCS